MQVQIDFGLPLQVTLQDIRRQGGQIQCWFQPDSYGLLRAELSQDGVTVVTMKFSDFSFTFPEGGAEYSTECP